jgi:hypothetical protein
MGPAAVVPSCVALISTAGHVAEGLLGNFYDSNDMPVEFNKIIHEIESLKSVLALLAESEPSLLKLKFRSLSSDLQDVISSCHTVVCELDVTITRHGSDCISSLVSWALTGETEIAKLRSSIGFHQSALQLTLELIPLWVQSCPFFSCHI